MSDDLRLPLDRVTYREGQRLAARDLADDRRRDARLRRLHLRALHDTWGIALGFEVEQVDDDGEAVDSGGIVAVGKGYAVDGQGRELLLAESVRPTLPRTEAPEIRVLTARYRQDGAYSESTDLAAVCLCGGLDPRHERPCFAWRRQDEVCFGPEVPLVQATISNGRIQGELDLRVRRYARSLARPHLATGTTDSGRSGWRGTRSSGWSWWSTPPRPASPAPPSTSPPSRATSATGPARTPWSSPISGAPPAPIPPSSSTL